MNFGFRVDGGVRPSWYYPIAQAMSASVWPLIALGSGRVDLYFADAIRMGNQFETMANPFIAVRITPELDAAIAARMQETGQSKSDVVIEALKSYLGIMPFTQRLTIIEERLAALEDLTDPAAPSQHHSDSRSELSTHTTEHPGQ
jgi:hypothetical protein